MNRSWFPVQVLGSALSLFLSACSTSQPVGDTVFADGPRGTVSLQRVEDSWFKTAHPIAVNPLLLTHVLRGIQVQPAPDDQATAVQVFSDEEVAFLTPLMSTALSKATKNQVVAFRVTHESDPGGGTTGGVLFTRGRLLHLWLTHYRTNGVSNNSSIEMDRQGRNPQRLEPRQLRFVPETAQRSSRNQQPDAIEPPPLATLVIDYTMLATLLNMPSEAVPSQAFPGDGPPRHQAETQTDRPDHGSPTSQDATPPSRAEEAQTLKDVVKQQALELDVVREEMRTLRRRLSEMERFSPKP